MPSVLALHEAEHKMRQQMQDKADRYLSPAHVLQGCYAWDDESGSDDGKRQGVERNRRQLHPFVRPLRPELAIVGAAFVIPGVTSLENVRWA